jgi:hypothetical protein
MRITPGSSVNSTSNRSRSTWACSPGWVSNRTSKGMAGPGLMSRNLDDLNIQLRQWLDTVANRRLHATTQRVVNEAFAEECRTEAFATCPLSYGVEARTTPVHEGIVSVSGNLYGVPDTTRRRMLDVHVFADKIASSRMVCSSPPMLHSKAAIRGALTRHIEGLPERPGRQYAG